MGRGSHSYDTSSVCLWLGQYKGADMCPIQKQMRPHYATIARRGTILHLGHVGSAVPCLIWRSHLIAPDSGEDLVTPRPRAT